MIEDCPSDAYGEKEPADVAPKRVFIYSPFAGFISGKEAYLTNGVKSMHFGGKEVSSVPLYIPFPLKICQFAPE